MYCDKMYYSLCTKTNKQHVSPEYCCRGSWFLFSILKVASWCRLAHLVYFLASFDKLGLFSCCSSLGLPVGPEHKARALSPSRTGCSAAAQAAAAAEDGHQRSSRWVKYCCKLQPKLSLPCFSAPLATWHHFFWLKIFFLLTMGWKNFWRNIPSS